MKLYNDYLETKSAEDDFLMWLLLRKMSTKQQLLFAVVLIILWLIIAPHLDWWVLFFKIFLGYAVISFGIKKFIWDGDLKRSVRRN